MNTNSPYSKARIGIISNEQKNCLSCDSRIGFGTGGPPDDNTCGNEALMSPDNGVKHIKAIGYIMVQWEGTDEMKSISITYINTLSSLFFLKPYLAWT